MLCSVSSEFDKLNLGDKRLTARAAMLASAISENPETSINAACGSFSASKAAYRFFENERISSEQLLQQHVSNTCERITSTASPILVIQDTTDLIYTKHPSTEGLGSICQNNGFKEGVKGIRLHSSLAVTTAGVPLGILKQTFFTYEEVREARGQKEKNDNFINKKFSIDKKVSYRWLDHYRSTNEMLPNLEVVHVADREGDIYEFLQILIGTPTKFVIRSSMNRRTHEGPKSQDYESIDQKLSIASRIGQIKVKKDNEEIACDVKSVNILFKPPQRQKTAQYFSLSPLAINVVEVKGKSGKTEIHWKLLTNLSCLNMADVMAVIEIYKTRWCIESFHRILKSGFGIEKARLNQRSKIEKLATMLSIISWHIFWLYTLSRECPNLSIKKIFDSETIRVLLLSAKKLEPKYRRCRTIKDGVLIIARLGGYLGRKSDGPPGMITIWRGWRTLQERLMFMESMPYG